MPADSNLNQILLQILASGVSTEVCNWAKAGRDVRLSHLLSASHSQGCYTRLPTPRQVLQATTQGLLHHVPIRAQGIANVLKQVKHVKMWETHKLDSIVVSVFDDILVEFDKY